MAGSAGASTSSTNSPRSRFGSAANQSGASASVSRVIVSNFFVISRATTSERSPPSAAPSSCHRGANAMRRLVDHERARLARDATRAARAAPSPRRQEAQEQPALGIEPRRGHGGDRGAGAGNRHHGESRIAHRAHETRARIADRRRAGIADQRHAASGAQLLARSASARAASLCSWSEIGCVAMP